REWTLSFSSSKDGRRAANSSGSRRRAVKTGEAESEGAGAASRSALAGPKKDMSLGPSLHAQRSRPSWLAHANPRAGRHATKASCSFGRTAREIQLRATQLCVTQL